MCDTSRYLKLLAPLLALCLAWAALFTTAPVGAAPLAVQVTITPPAGPAGTQFVVTGSGFTPGDVLLYGFDDPRQPVVLGQVTVSADGRFTVTIDSTGYEARDYAFHVVSQQSVPPTMPLAIVKFTVTAGAAPGLPNTGGGWGAHAANGEWPIALWVLLMSGVGLLFFRRRSGWLAVGWRHSATSGQRGLPQTAGAHERAHHGAAPPDNAGLTTKSGEPK